MKDDWLSHYLEYTSEHEAPEIFHRWAGLAGIASVLNRKVWIVRASSKTGLRYNSYPGQSMIVLVAGSGRMRKSTTVGFIEDILRMSQTVKLYSGKITPERLLTKLAGLSGGAILTVMCDEFSYFFPKAKYAESMIENILKLSAAKDSDEYETQDKQHILKNACFTMLLATTPSSLGSSIPPSAQEDGFTSRFIWPFAGEPRGVNAMFDDDEVDAGTQSEEMLQIIGKNGNLRLALIEGLVEMSRFAGKIPVSAEARIWFKNWYSAYSKSIESRGEGWPSRLHEHLVRTANLIGTARRMQPGIEICDFKDALKQLLEVQTNFPKVFAQIGKHTSADQQKRIIALFDKAGKEMSTRDIIRRTLSFFKDIKELRLMLDGLEQAGILMRATINASGRGEDTTWIMKEI